MAHPSPQDEKQALPDVEQMSAMERAELMTQLMACESNGEKANGKKGIDFTQVAIIGGWAAGVGFAAYGGCIQGVHTGGAYRM